RTENPPVRAQAVNKLIPPPPTTPAPAPTPAPTQEQSSGGSLAYTGADETTLRYAVIGGAILLLAGTGLLLAARRRRTH
ncbi:LPXTG cell wall anchor domain-containing protein, partial [Kitasatospora sp. NPDC004531]